MFVTQHFSMITIKELKYAFTAGDLNVYSIEGCHKADLSRTTSITIDSKPKDVNTQWVPVV